MTIESPIAKISEDQNTITHDDGIVAVFKEGGNEFDCCYYNTDNCQLYIPCCKVMRDDKINGIFIAEPK